MPNVKISELTALTPPDAADLVPVTDSSASQTKRTTVGEIVGIINGDVDVADDGTATISELPMVLPVNCYKPMPQVLALNGPMTSMYLAR
jgi:hypothetical protein